MSAGAAQRQFEGRFTVGEIVFEELRVQTLETRQGSLENVEARSDLGLGEPRGRQSNICSVKATTREVSGAPW